jgi:hypothetical protein
VVERRRPEEERIGHREHRGRRADPDREREHGDDREAGVTDQHPPPEAQIGDQILEHHARKRSPPKSTLPRRQEFDKNSAMPLPR